MVVIDADTVSSNDALHGNKHAVRGLTHAGWLDSVSEMFEAFLGCNTCDVSDALDSLSIAGQCRGLLPLWPGARPILGRALTIKLHPKSERSTVIGTLEAIDIAKPGDLLVFDNDGRCEINSFGSIAHFVRERRASSVASSTALLGTSTECRRSTFRSTQRVWYRPP
jgi:hypothetical protein